MRQGEAGESVRSILVTLTGLFAFAPLLGGAIWLSADASDSGKPAEVRWIIPETPDGEQLDPALEALLERTADEAGVDTALVKAVAWYESRWQQDAVSHLGAVGVMQLMPATADWAQDHIVGREVEWVESTMGNVELGVAVLARLLELASGNEEKALAAYYEGWTKVDERGIGAGGLSYASAVLSLVPYFNE
jgi:soluble lytic murein transglycosylase-like protein